MKYFNQFFTKKNTTLIALIVMIFCFEQNSFWVEKYYSNGFYKITSIVQRSLFSWIPFSIGDILYVLVVLYIVVKIFRFIQQILNAKERLIIFKAGLTSLLQFLSIIYILFKLLWGLNYSRLGVAHQFNLKKYAYTKEELIDLTRDLIFDANFCRKQIADTNLPRSSIDSIFAESKKCYQKISSKYTFLKAQQFAVKPSLYSLAGNYFGYTGYYNPFTGEAQIRSDLPSVLLPVICCHEVAHQLAYASEEEANFIGCIAANESDNIIFRYSLDLELIDYAQRELASIFIESNRIKELIATNYSLKNCMSEQVKKDRKAIRQFFEKNRNDIANYSNIVYDKYLKLNKQSKGISSYNEVIGWILGYKKQLEHKD
ncbi:MAG: DUF3810 domain-containing protein [Bacteroidetes bacterium]|nr:DUF3810 domain-containing protein [Bacteroidota bacterium]